MSSCLQLNSQTWELREASGLKLFLPRQHRDGSIYFQANWSFVPTELSTQLPATSVPGDESKLRLQIIGWVPGLRDWRDLENLFVGYGEALTGKQIPDTHGPDIWVWLPGQHLPLRFGHWETDLQFGERRGAAFDFTLDATCPTDRVEKLRTELSVKQFFHQPTPPDWELPEWIDEVDQELSLAGSFQLQEILCSVPINSPQPLEWARQLARRELAVDAASPGTLIDAAHPAAHHHTNDGISTTGRLVVLPLPPE